MRFSTSLALAALGLAASALPAAAGTLLVPQRYPTIQQALDAAKPYDTVLVSPKSGGKSYSEAVTISTPHVTLQGSNNPVIDGAKLAVAVYPNAIQIRADHVSVRGLTVQNFGYGDDALSPASAISVGYFSDGFLTEYSSSDIEISGCTLRHNYQAIAIDAFSGPNPNYAPGGANLKGYRLLGNLITDNSSGGGLLSGDAVLVSGNQFLSNGGDGLDVQGTGITVSGNEAGNNSGTGLVAASTALYNPAVNDPKNPNPAPSVTTLNYAHDNLGTGIAFGGTQTVLANAVTNNTGRGIFLTFADYSTISGNFVTGTRLAGYTTGDGAGIYAQYSSTPDSGLTITANQISSNVGDGIYFYEIGGGLVSYNNVTGNQGIGIHLSDYSYFFGAAPTTVTSNRSQQNTIFDAQDDATVEGAPTVNIWTKNLFGKTNPVGLSK